MVDANLIRKLAGRLPGPARRALTTLLRLADEHGLLLYLVVKVSDSEFVRSG